MDDEFDRLDALLEHYQDTGTRQISQEPERISDETFGRVCTSLGTLGMDELQEALQPLLARFSNTTATGTEGGDGSADDRTYERGAVLREIIAEVLERVEEFRSLDQYIWLLKFSCGLCLLKDLPVGISLEINKVVRSVASLDTEKYEFDPVMIHIITKSLFEEIPLRGMNLIYVVKKLAVLNQKLLYYISIALIFAGINHYALPEEPIQLYRPHSLSDIFTQLQSLHVDNLKQKLNIQKLFLVLKLLSCYQNAAILRHSLDSWDHIQEQHRCFAECFQFTLEQKKSYLRWLQMTHNIVNSLSAKCPDQKIAIKEDFLLVIELIDLDMIPLMEDDISDRKE